MQFNANQHQARVAGGGAPVLPQGKYPVILGTIESKPTRDNATTGHSFLEATFFVVDGEQRGRKIVQRYNVGHSSPNTVEMAMNELACLSLAVGVPAWDNPMALTNRPFVLDIMVEERGKWTNQQGQEQPGGKQNRIIGYYTAQGIDATTLGGGVAQAAAQSAPTVPPQWAGGAPAQVPGAVAAPVAAPAPTWGAPPAPAPTGAPAWGAPNGAPQTGPVMNGAAPPWGAAAPAPAPAGQTPPWAGAAPAQAQAAPSGPTPPWATPGQ